MIPMKQQVLLYEGEKTMYKEEDRKRRKELMHLSTRSHHGEAQFTLTSEPNLYNDTI